MNLLRAATEQAQRNRVDQGVETLKAERLLEELADMRREVFEAVQSLHGTRCPHGVFSIRDASARYYTFMRRAELYLFCDPEGEDPWSTKRVLWLKADTRDHQPVITTRFFSPTEEPVVWMEDEEKYSGTGTILQARGPGSIPSFLQQLAQQAIAPWM